MVMVLINWLYIAITSFLTGYGILSLFANLTGYKIRRTISYFLAGLVFVTVYAQFYSLAAGVGVLAGVGLWLICLGLGYVYRQNLAQDLRCFWGSLYSEKWKMAVYAALILLFAFGTSRGYMHFDTGLYHAQSIRWIEEYGVVPGLANIQARFGYNSSAFVLTAFYSMKDVFGQSLHATAGYFALLASFAALDLYRVFTTQKISLADFIRIGLVFYLGVIFSQMMSPASDYYAQLLLFMILILWLEEDAYQKEKKQQCVAPYGLLCILIVYAVTIKFSVAVLLLLVIKPAVMLLRKKDWKGIGGYIGTGFATALPFFVRNVVISGWLVYPFAGIDLFSVDWKIPKGQVQYDAMEIGVYGKGITDVTKHDTPFLQWIMPWFEGLKALEKVFVLATVAACVAAVLYFVGIVIWKNCRKGDARRKKVSMLWNRDWDFGLVFIVFMVSTVFWFVSAPLIRYGYAYITVVPLLMFGQLFLLGINTERVQKYFGWIHGIFCVLLIGFLLTRVKGLSEDILRTWKEPYYIAQMDYADEEADIQMVGGQVFYVPKADGQIGYHKFPSSMLVQPIELRGDSLKEGFRQVTQD